MKSVTTLLGGLLAAVFFLVPVTASADGSRVLLGGYCPVAYVDAQKAVYGSVEFRSVHDGKEYHFVNADAKAAFDQSPSKYVSAVRYDAWCATALAMGKRLASDPEQFLVRNGAVFLFSSAEAKAMFLKDVDGMTKKANQHWNEHQADMKK
jgi:YHS domain-containing protein